MNRDPLTEMKVDTLSPPWEDSIPHSEVPSVHAHDTHAETDRDTRRDGDAHTDADGDARVLSL